MLQLLTSVVLGFIVVNAECTGFVDIGDDEANQGTVSVVLWREAAKKEQRSQRLQGRRAAVLCPSTTHHWFAIHRHNDV